MKRITDIDQLDLNKAYTYADYLTWRFVDRVELLWGRIKKMAAAPSTKHQQVIGELHVKMRNAMGKNPCQVFMAPFDVRLPLNDMEKSNASSVVQPDLCVVCDEQKIDEKGCNGAPDLMVEVLSPSSSTRDLRDKRKLYEQAGVKEYWVVDPFGGAVHVFVADETGKFQSRYPITAEDELASVAIPGLVISMPEVFPDIVREAEGYYSDVRRF